MSNDLIDGSPLDRATEMVFGFDKAGKVFCCGWVVPEWGTNQQFKREHKAHRIEVVKAKTPRCEELMQQFRKPLGGYA